jgi:hypothetical protein
MSDALLRKSFVTKLAPWKDQIGSLDDLITDILALPEMEWMRLGLSQTAEIVESYIPEPHRDEYMPRSLRDWCLRS